VDETIFLLRIGPTLKKEVPMSRQTAIAKLRDVLIRRRDAIRSALNGDLTLLQQISKDGGDSADYAMDATQEDVSSQLAEVESRELGSIEDALGRMKDGSFGDCEGCAKPIPLARLQALPHTTMCIQCARQAELNPRDPDAMESDAESATWS
jgi:DnaK suppressor protein